MKNFVKSLALVSILLIPVSGLAEEVVIEVTEQDCQRIKKHLARDDVRYKPGVDVHGKPVVSADVSDNRLKIPDNITIDLSLPLKDLYLLAKPPPRSLQNAEAQVGKLEYNMLSGKMKFNGQELADPALHAIAEECQNRYGKP